MKVTISRASLINGDHFYRVRDEQKTVLASFYFDPSELDPNNVKFEPYALKQAEIFAARMETGKFDKDIEEIVYQSPDTNEDLPPGVFETPGI